MEFVQINKEDHIAEVILNRPNKMNALNPVLLKDIVTAAETVSQDESVRCVILRGEGKAFCAGLDLASFDMNNGIGNIRERTHGLTNIWQQVAWAWRICPVPVIAAAHGIAFGGGLQILSGCDIKYIHPETKLSIMETKWGIIPDMSGTLVWHKNVREDIIKELAFTSRVFSAQEAVNYGFATHLSENPVQDAMKLAKEIAMKSPDAIVRTKKVLNTVPSLPDEEALMMESVEQQALLKTSNQIEAVFSGMQKRVPNFKNFRES